MKKGGSASDAAAGSETGIRHIRQHTVALLSASTSVGPKPNFANILVEVTDSKYTKKQEENLDAYMKANYPNAITRTMLFKLSPAVDAAIEIGFIGNNTDTLAC